MSTNIYKGGYQEEIIEFTGNLSTSATTHSSDIFTIRPSVKIHWLWDGPASLVSTASTFSLEWSMDGIEWIGSYVLQAHTTAVNSHGVIDPESTANVSNGVLYRLAYLQGSAESVARPFKGMIIVPNPHFNK